MAGMGPPPKPAGQRRRRNATVAMTRLPAEGRKGRAPAWPLEARPTAEQRGLWASVWKTPQAAAWERLGWTRAVARYVRVVLAAEEGLDVRLLAEARQMEDRLGLSPMAMLRLRWEVAADEVAEQRQEPATASSRVWRLRAVDPSAAAGSSG